MAAVAEPGSLDLMKRYAKFWATLIFCVVGVLTFVSGVSCAMMVAQWTDSGLLGICGPYGEHAGLVGCIFRGSFPAAIVAGVFSARYFYRRVTDEHKADHSKKSIRAVGVIRGKNSADSNLLETHPNGAVVCVKMSNNRC